MWRIDTCRAGTFATPTPPVKLSAMIPEVNDDTSLRARQLHRLVAVGLLGVLLIAVGLAVDAVAHALNPDLAAEEGLFTIANPGHVLLGVGIVASAVGLYGAATMMLEASESKLLRNARRALALGIVGFVVVMGVVIAGPGLGHDHSDDHAHGPGVSDGTPISSAVVADIDRSRYPPAEAEALVALAWSRTGSLGTVGHQHEHEHGNAMSAAELSPDEREVLEAQLAAAAEVAADFDTVEEVTAAGYVQASSRAEGVGAHWVKWSLVDRPFDPAAPSMLLFEEVSWGQGPELVAYSYWVASDTEPEGFAGETDMWHQHVGLCFEDGWLRNEDVPDRDACAGDWINGSDLWMLHAWIVPGMENRNGVFASVNPRLCERFCE